MDISTEVAAVQAASEGSELRQPLVDALDKLNSGSLPAVTVSDTGKILKVGANGWEVGEKSGYMPVPTATKQITENGTYDVTDFASAIVGVSGGGGTTILGGTQEPTADIGVDGNIYIKYKDFSSLSNEYIALSFIQSSGTQYINTGIPARVQLKAEIDCQWLSSGDQTVLGGSSNINTNAIYLGYNSSNGKTYVGYANSWHDFNTGAVDQNRHKWIIDLQTNAQTITVDGVVKATTSNAFTETISVSTLYVFARSTGLNALFTGRVYRIKIYDYLDNGNLVRDYIPAKRKSDNTLGLYDLVNNVFYENNGTGTFIASNQFGNTPIDTAYLKVDGSWIILEDGNWSDINT